MDKAAFELLQQLQQAIVLGCGLPLREDELVHELNLRALCPKSAIGSVKQAYLGPGGARVELGRVEKVNEKVKAVVVKRIIADGNI